jgi:hypothetical protein
MEHELWFLVPVLLSTTASCSASPFTPIISCWVQRLPGLATCWPMSAAFSFSAYNFCVTQLPVSYNVCKHFLNAIQNPLGWLKTNFFIVTTIEITNFTSHEFKWTFLTSSATI